MRKLSISSLLILVTGFTFSQTTKIDTLKTEEISVVKPYTPTISDAFKIVSNPEIDPSNSFQKETVTYNFFSVPVASTFTPSKGKAQGLVKAPKEKLYDNYVLAGFGNYTTPVFEAFVHAGDAKYNDFGVLINYLSSQGDIKDVILDDNFSKTKVELFYKQFERDFNWKADLGYNRQRYNYYGLPSHIVFDENIINTIDEKQVYTAINLGGNIVFDNTIFKEGTVKITGFNDYYDSNEFRFNINPNFEYLIADNFLKGGVLIDFLAGKFKQNYGSPDDLKYSFLNFGIDPNYEILTDDLSINIGAKLYYTFDFENNNNSFKIYPNIIASYQLIEDIFIVTAGVTGDLVQNTYNNFTAENPFVSPTLNILQTDQQYNAFAGLKGKLASNIGYNFSASYGNENNKPLYIQNQILTDGLLAVDKAYEAGNSFSVIYDDVKTIQVYGEINVDFSKEFQLTGSFNYANYNTTNQPEAWNLPEIKASVLAKYNAKNWFAGAQLFFNGNTKDFVIPYNQSPENGSIVTNNSYVDLNLNAGYNFTKQLAAFARVNNAVGNSYNRFVNYPVQSLQVLGGVIYKFNL
ncbi:TonB-dependent receptor [Lutibacter sp. HS1-25]|uniref:TonB-dependent receptor n=1 Tax=Lutibacter sp. HS1-25 TaxID=2485000 RepID=UPI00101340FB|nr:TonB-dependent receptor [Lutibacter sp. HS1-25]